MFGRLYGVLLPFFVSFLLAWLLDPLVTFVQTKCKVKFRILSVAITLVVFVGVLALGVYLLIPAIGRDVKKSAAAVEQYFDNFDADRYFTAEQQEKIQETLDGLNMKSLLSYPEVRDALKDILPKVGGWITGGLNWLSELLVVFIGFLYLLFLLISFPSIRANWRSYVPAKYLPQVSTIVHELSVNMNAYFRGQGLIALCVGVLFAIGFTLIGMPMGFVMGLIIGVLNLVPYMQALGIPPCIILSLVQSAQTGQPVWLTLLLMAIVFIVVQTFQDMFLTPKIMGKVTGLGPAAILLSLSIWGAMMGVIGMIIALPLTSLAISCYRHYVLHEPFASELPAEVNVQKPEALQQEDAVVREKAKKVKNRKP
jgi:predicted PurR-regulated permease PerM